jgi:pSer/pThr/pTyr-binding forkhead associated (FHA) protein
VPSNPRIKLLPDGPYIEIDGGSLYLGRDCHLAQRIPALTSKVVSSRHLRVALDGETWTLEDLGSTNGTWLRGKRLTNPARLDEGEVFALGRAGPQFQWIAPVRTGPRRAAAAPRTPPDTGGGTLLEDEPADAEQTFLLNEQADGSGERPFRVGKTPSVVLRHLRTGKEFRAEGYTVVIGRDPGAAQILVRTPEERHVSGRHVEIQFRTGSRYPVVRDLGSSNGTWLNDRPLKVERELKPGDEIVLGAATTTLKVITIDA